MKGIVVVIVGIGLIVAGIIIFILSMIYQSVVGKKTLKELLDKYE